MPTPPPTSILEYKLFDLSIYLKFMHNGFINKNSLADWGREIALYKNGQKFPKNKVV